MNDAAERLNRALEGRYAVEGELGQGGMATVFLARDLRHDRKVALKVLRPELAAVVGGERFLAEIRTTAALQHPHILPLHDSGEADGFLFYVMPYMEGVETLADRLTRERQLPVDEGLAITVKIAAALQYAHEQGVVHRDIKPANILLSRGEPLVADFGIALAVTEAGAGRITETGLSLGTPHYMSPEQASGDRALDRRSDVYALGCVLYEMLAGEPPYAGPTPQSVLARILTEEPRPLRSVRRTVPAHVEAAVSKALEKLPADRFESARQFAEALERPGFTHMTAAVTADRDAGARAASRPAAFSASAPLMGLGAVAVVATAAAAVGWMRPAPAPEPRVVVRFAVESDSTHTSGSWCCGPPVTIAPQGDRIVYEGTDDRGQRLYQRPLDELTAQAIPGTEGARSVFFSADGQWVGFAEGNVMKKVRLDGGSPLAITSVDQNGLAASWGPDNRIVYGSGFTGGLFRVSADGGEPERLTTVDSAGGETRHGTPHVMPDGRHVLFTVSSESEWTVELLDMETRERRPVVVGGRPTWARDRLVYALNDGTIMAVRFDDERLDTIGGPVRIADGAQPRIGLVEYDLSRTGTLVVRPSGFSLERQMVVVEDGRRRELRPSGPIRFARFSPDGRRIAYEVQGVDGVPDDIWIHDLRLDNGLRLTRSGGNSRPTWSPDGRWVLFERDEVEQPGLWRQAADGSGEPELLLASPDAVTPRMSPDGRWLVWMERDDIMLREADGSGEPRPFFRSPEFNEWSPEASPDSRWLAYESDESGAPEVYVQPFPAGGGRVRVSTDGGFAPRWSPDGGHLFFRDLRANLMRVEVRTEPTLEIGPPEGVAEGLAPHWDVHPDGSTLLYLDDGAETAPRLFVTVNAVR
jgi:eukaryotic-like serine/threonine-protein kinase